MSYFSSPLLSSPRFFLPPHSHLSLLLVANHSVLVLKSVLGPLSFSPSSSFQQEEITLFSSSLRVRGKFLVSLLLSVLVVWTAFGFGSWVFWVFPSPRPTTCHLIWWMFVTVPDLFAPRVAEGCRLHQCYFIFCVRLTEPRWLGSRGRVSSRDCRLCVVPLLQFTSEWLLSLS